MRYHLEQIFHASRVYIIASGSLARNTDKIVKLLKAIGDSKVVGLRKGTTRHMPWSEILSIAAGLLTLTPSLHSGLVAQLTQILSFGFVTTWIFADKVPLEHRVASSAFDFHPACPEVGPH